MSDFLAMGGYGAYVWPAYGLTAIVLLGLVIVTWQGLRGRRRALERLEAELPSRRERRGADRTGAERG